MTQLRLIILVYCFLELACVDNAEVEIGNAIDLLRNYGLLMRIFPVNVNHNDFLQHEFSSNIFDKAVSRRVTETTSPHNAGTWRIKAYKNIFHVIDAFLTDYKIECVENVRNSFTALWPLKVLAEFIGLQQAFLSGNFSFLLVKHDRCVKHYKMSSIPNIAPMLDARLVDAVRNITIGEGRTVFDFISHFGSHYVNSFSAGSVLYQVFAFRTEYYKCFSALVPEFDLKYLNKCTDGSHFFSGKIKTLSNSTNIEARLNQHTKVEQFNNTQNIFQVMENENLLFDLCDPENLVLTGFDLAVVSNMIRDRLRSPLIREIIDNQMKLRDLSL